MYISFEIKKMQQICDGWSQNKLIQEITSKQSPVEDLLRQADSLIANQQPKAEVNN